MSEQAQKKSFQEIVKQRVEDGKAKILSFEDEAKKFAKSILEKGKASQEEGKKRLDELSAKVLGAVDKVSKMKEADILKHATAFRKELETKLGGRLEKLFESLGLPSKEEVQKLSERLESLSKRVGELAERLRSYGRKGRK
ncbi:MAG: phasin family protein [Deltaproteobacteria bacterium]|nr:phasin family protein [Deltaproteobacteria bacterium]